MDIITPTSVRTDLPPKNLCVVDRDGYTWVRAKYPGTYHLLGIQCFILTIDSIDDLFGPVRHRYEHCDSSR